MPGRRVQTVANIIAIQHKAPNPPGVKFVIDQVGDRALAASAQTGKPDDAAGMSVASLAFGSRHRVLVPMDLDLMLVGHKKYLPMKCRYILPSLLCFHVPRRNIA